MTDLKTDVLKALAHLCSETRNEVSAILDAHLARVAALERDNQDKTKWALDTETRLTAEVRAQTEHLGTAVEALHHTEKELEERTAWALRLQDEARRLEEQVALFKEKS